MAFSPEEREQIEQTLTDCGFDVVEIEWEYIVPGEAGIEQDWYVHEFPKVYIRWDKTDKNNKARKKLATDDLQLAQALRFVLSDE